MNAHNPSRHFSTAGASIIALALALALTGCKSAPPMPTDASLTADISNRLASDPNLSGQSIQASAASGVVTLTGTVYSDNARNIAGGDAGQISGVKTVVNNLLVQPPPPTPAVAVTAAPPPPPAAKPEKIKKPSAAIASQQPYPPPPAPVERAAPPSAPVATEAPPPPPQPVVHNLTLDAGFTIPVRITQTLDSATTQTGDKFTGVIASDIIVDGLIALPQGTEVTGHVDEAKDATHYKGISSLTLSLSSLNSKGRHVDITTDPFTKQGEGRGKNTAEKVGGGAAVGAILGGIFGGGKGAAIGAAAGGGVGAGANTVTRGQQVQIPSETVVRFKLSDPVVLHVTSGGPSSGPDSSPSLERRPN